jgi:hypothetical protein
MIDCKIIQDITGWSCVPSGNRSYLATSPITLGEDGELVSFYIADCGDGTFHITDGGETAMHSSLFGVNFSKSRIDKINDSYGVRFASIGHDGVISASGAIDDTSAALWDAVKLALSLSFNSKKWMPKHDAIRFRAMVERILVKKYENEGVARSIKVIGISGHSATFPFAVKLQDGNNCLIDTLASSNGKLDWSHVYHLAGKMSDVKQADTESRRLVIVEDGVNRLEFGRASSLLSQSSNIQT